MSARVQLPVSPGITKDVTGHRPGEKCGHVVSLKNEHGPRDRANQMWVFVYMDPLHNQHQHSITNLAKLLPYAF